jgi:hypothetical protein
MNRRGKWMGGVCAVALLAGGLALSSAGPASSEAFPGANGKIAYSQGRRR